MLHVDAEHLSKPRSQSAYVTCRSGSSAGHRLAVKKACSQCSAFACMRMRLGQSSIFSSTSLAKSSSPCCSRTAAARCKAALSWCLQQVYTGAEHAQICRVRSGRLGQPFYHGGCAIKHLIRVQSHCTEQDARSAHLSSLRVTSSMADQSVKLAARSVTARSLWPLSRYVCAAAAKSLTSSFHCAACKRNESTAALPRPVVCAHCVALSN